MPGKKVVILGSGDIGLIMARRMTLEGAEVKAVAELMPYSGGLKRNIVQCLDDFGIPLKLSHTVVDIKGKERVEGITLAEVDENRRPIPGTEEFFECDTLLLSVGLIPENELSGQAGVKLSNVTSGPVVNESLETNVEGIFACGNVLHVHDLVDFVSEEAGNAGRNAALYINNNGEDRIPEEIKITLSPQNGVRYTVPSEIRIGHMAEEQLVASAWEMCIKLLHPGISGWRTDLFQKETGGSARRDGTDQTEKRAASFHSGRKTETG